MYLITLLRTTRPHKEYPGKTRAHFKNGFKLISIKEISWTASYEGRVKIRNKTL